MTARATPYLSFAGNAREAMEFYRSVFGEELDIATYADLHRAQEAKREDWVAHSMLSGATGVTLMGSDTAAPVGQSVSVALGGDETELAEYFKRLSGDGTVTVPFARAAWGARYGQCVDKFGTTWLVNATTSEEQQ
jgi:PhnB protein